METRQGKMNQALYHPGPLVCCAPGPNLVLHPLADPQPILILHSPRRLFHPCPAPEGFIGEPRSLVSPFWGAQGSQWAPPLKSAWIYSLIYFSAPNKRQETGVGGNPWRRKGMEKQNRRAWR